MAAEITTYREREEEELGRERERRRTTTTENQRFEGSFGSFCREFEKDVRRGTKENGEATDSPSGEGAEKEGKVGERTEEEERRCGVVIGRRTTRRNGACVANASG